MLAAKQPGKLDKGDVDFGFDRSQDHVVVGLDVMRTQVATLWQGCDPVFGAPGVNPTNRSRHRNAKTFSRSVTGRAAGNGSNQPITKILGSARTMNAGLQSSMHGESQTAASREALLTRYGRIML